MPLLKNLSKKMVLAQDIIEAKSFGARAKGLLGRTDLPHGSVMWIPRCNSIHTWFMKFSLDLVFADKDLKVCAVYENIPPWKIIGPILKARSVFEFSQGSITKELVETGDQLHVGH